MKLLTFIPETRTTVKSPQASSQYVLHLSSADLPLKIEFSGKMYMILQSKHGGILMNRA